MTHFNLALIGFGNVGKALAQLLLDQRQEILDRYAITYAVTGIYTHRHGAAIDPNGLDLKRAINSSNLSELTTVAECKDSFDFIQRCHADVLFENSPVNYETGQPAIDHLRTAIGFGMHAITANKGPVVHAYRQLSELAKAHGRRFLFESTVMDGCPIFSLFRDTLPAARLERFDGILNSTTNMILSRMEGGDGFEQAVSHCQDIGIAETDPSGDIDGWDASVKVAALVTVLMDIPLKPQEVHRQGIRDIGPVEIEQARQSGKRWKLICTAQRVSSSEVKAMVSPQLVEPDSPLYWTEGTTSIVQFTTDVLGRLTVLEENPGPHTTAYGCLADFLNAVKG